MSKYDFDNDDDNVIDAILKNLIAEQPKEKMVSLSVIEDIKQEIESCRGKFYKNDDNTLSTYMNGTLDRVLEIIDRHTRR